MVPHALTFQSDGAGLAVRVEKALAAESAPAAWEEAETVRTSLWRRLGRRGMRCLWGAQRLEHRQMVAQLRRIMAASTKPVLAYVVPFDIWKLRTGGGQRIAGIAKALSRDFNVLVLTSAWSVRKFAWHELGPDCHLLAAPTGAGFMERLRAGKGAGLFAFNDHFDQLPEFRWMLEAVADRAQAWGFVHPIAWPVVHPYLRPEQPVFYDANDDYAQFLQQAYGEAEDRLVARILGLERDLLQRATAAVFCTADDRAAVQRRNPDCAVRLLVVPNGVDTAACRVVYPGEAHGRRQAAGLERPLAVFMGSIHKPNREAVEFIVREMVPNYTQVLFVVMGLDLEAYRGAGHVSADRANLVWTGPVSEAVKEAVFSLADIALAPLIGGTGSSLKIPDYVAHGKIVVATPIGLRGFEDLAKFPAVISAEDVRAALTGVLERLETDPQAFDPACRNAREWAERSLDWSVAAEPLVEVVRKSFFRTEI